MPDAPDPTVVDPQGHRVAFENEHVRILQIRLPPGAAVPMHSHPPRVIVAVSSYRIRLTDRAGNVTIVDRRPGEAIWSDGEEHAAEMVTDTHAIEVEIRSLH